jgi:hypothetical protein
MRHDYLHLDKQTRKLVDSSALIRIRHIQKDRFIPYRAVTSVLDLMESFVTRPISIRPPCLALIGDSGCGKSTLMDEFQRRHNGDGHPGLRVVLCTLDPHPTMRVSQRCLLTALGVPANLSTFQPWVNADDLIRRALAELGTRLVIFDEAWHLNHLDRSARSLMLDWIKWISTANRVSVVCAGIPGFEDTIRREAQLETRFHVMRVPRWTVGPAFGQFLDSYERSLPLRRPSGLHSVAIQERLLRESGLRQHLVGITQGITHVLECAAIAAIHTGTEKVTPALLSAWRDDLEPAVSKSPKPRKRSHQAS